jgi:hypothetical protein
VNSWWGAPCNGRFCWYVCFQLAPKPSSTPRLRRSPESSGFSSPASCVSSRGSCDSQELSLPDKSVSAWSSIAPSRSAGLRSSR